tara:strand:+ start:160 stop:627 length:468 start_codon:yes stop_codon:yes gene_type:complete
VPNIEFLSDRFTVFELSLAISQEKIVALGQVSTFAMLFIFITRETKKLILWWRAKAANRLRIQQNEIRLDFMYKLGWDGDYREYSQDPSGEIEEMSDTHEYELKSLENRYEMIANSVDTTAETILKYILPITFAVIAIFCPNALSWCINAISGEQ